MLVDFYQEKLMTKVHVRQAHDADVEPVVEMVHELGVHEGAPGECRLTTSQISPPSDARRAASLSTPT